MDETLDDGLTKKPILDLNEIPFKSLKKKDIKPSLECLKEEVKRRSRLEVNRANIPKPNGWSAPKCVEWLKDNPIKTKDDVAFLYRKAKEMKEIAANATQKAPAASANQSLDGEPRNKWFGPLPYLRLIHCLLEDDIKERWIHRNDPKSIQEIDARNSNARAENAFELIASRWNSTDFEPTTMIAPGCHVDFSTGIDIGFQATADFARATPTKVKDKIAKMKTNLTLIIQKWERSGQGDGGRLNEDDDDDDGSGSDRFEWGRSSGRIGAFDCRQSFLGPNPSYLLYFWDVLDTSDLFSTTMNRLSDEAGASSANDVPSVVTTKGKSTTKTDVNDEVSVFVTSFREVIVEASRDATIAADCRHTENKQDLDKRHKEAQEGEDKRVVMKTNAADNRIILQAQVENKSYLKRRIDDLQDEARKIRFKIFESKENNKSREESFYNDELLMLENEINKCNDELEKR